MAEVENRPWKILLVEDDEDDYVLTRALLSVSRGDRFDLLWARNYDSAFQILAENDLDAVLVDHYLGKNTGLELIREAVSQGQKVPFILLTGNGSYELDVEAAKAGAADYLVKSEVSPPLLERTIRYAIARREAETELGKRTEHIEVQHKLIEQRELERLKIAQDLHDGPLQGLIGISFNIQEAIVNTDTGHDRPEDLKPQLKSVLGSLQQQIQDLRSFCGELRPPALAPYGLEKAIRSHADVFQQKHPEFHIRLDLEPDRQILPEQVRLALYRIYQEMMNNILRHSQATAVMIRLKLTAQQVSLEVEDNGRGFDVPANLIEYARQGHLGLVGMQERVDAAQGIMEISSHPGEGTKVRVVIPYA